MGIGALHRPHHLGVGDVELVLDIGGEDVPVGLDVLLEVVGNGNDKHAVARDGVMKLAAVELSEADALILGHLGKEEAAQQLDGVGTLLVDVVARVATHKALQLGTHEEVACRHLRAPEGKLGGGVASSGTGNEDFALVLGVEVDEEVAGHEACLHALGTCQPGLFVTGEDALDGAVLDVVGSQQRQLHRTAYTVVGTQRGSLGGQPLAINIGLDGVVVEVYLVVHQLVAHHIHVALQDDRLAVFHTLGGWFADNDIACLIDFGV